MSDKPLSILFLYSDQHRYDALGCTGHPLVQTPHLDNLARTGTLFTRAYTPIPVCAPARNCLFHGQWSFQHLAIANDGTEAPRSPDPELPNIATPFHEAGYYLGHVGKWQMDSGLEPGAFGFDAWVSDAGYGAWRAAQGLSPRPCRNGFFGESDPEITPDQSRPAWGADQTIRMLEEAHAQERPFLIMWAPPEPHLPNVVPPPYDTMYAPDRIPPWPGFPDPLTGKPYIQQQQRRTWRIDHWTWDDWAPIVGRYLGEISLLDAQIGRVLDRLESLGLADTTLVVYTPDHGDMCGGHGMIDKHYVMYEDVTHVPLIVRLPGAALSGQACDAWVSHFIDLPPTLLELAGLSIPPTFAGRSLAGLLRGTRDQAPGNEAVFSAYHGNQMGLFSQRMVRTRDWKYVWNACAEDECYCLRDDPGELRNRATDPTCAEVCKDLRIRLAQWMESERDPLLNGWTRDQLMNGLTR